MEIINDSSKNVAQATQLLKQYLEQNDIENADLLVAAVDLLDKTIATLTKT